MQEEVLAECRGALPGWAGLIVDEVDFGENYNYLVISRPAAGGYVQAALYMRPFVRNARDVRDIYLYSMPVLLLITAALGYALAAYPLTLLSAATRAMETALAALREGRPPENLLPFEALQERVGFDRYDAEAARYAKEDDAAPRGRQR